MTSVLNDEENKSAKLKQKLMNDVHVKEETRSFLSFSRENLSISHSDLEQGFNKHRFRPNKTTILSSVALLIALICLGLETWKLHCSIVNSREIEELKRDIEKLKHRFLEEDLLDELKAFEEQLYAEESTDDEEEDPGETDIDNADYDSNYEEEDEEGYSSSHDYTTDHRNTPPTYGSKPSDFPDASSTLQPVPSPPEPSSNKALMDFFSALRKVEAKRGEEFEKSVRENHKSIERERLLEEHKKKAREEKTEVAKNATKHKRDLSTVDSVSMSTLSWRDEGKERDPKESPVRKKSQSFHYDDGTVVLPSHRRAGRNQTKRIIVPRIRNKGNVEDDQDIEETKSSSINARDRHPPKKYYAHSRPDVAHVLPSTHQDIPSSQIALSHKRLTERAEDNGGRRSNWRDDRDGATEFAQTHEPVQNHEVTRQLRRGMTRRHLRSPRQVYAVHYGADSTLFSEEDEHTGNGRARHSEGIFKAWRPSDWVLDLGMNRHFALANDGRLTVNEPGLYLAYAQIHYLDEHDENGFHLLVNGRPILQCMIYSPGVGHKSRSCFSAQVTLLDAGDVLVLKDVGAERYTLFQQDKSFFGLAKLGEPRQQRHQTQRPSEQ